MDAAVTGTRAFAVLAVERAVGAARLALETSGGFARANGALPAQDYLFAGGPVTAPGFEASRFAARRLIAQRVEWRVPVPFPSVTLGRWGRSPAQALLAPYAHVVVVQGSAPVRRAASGAYPSAGGGLIPLFGLVRLDVARSLRGAHWSFAIDVGRAFWRIL